MQIFLDIETTPTRDPDVLADIRANIRPPASYKKPESIAAWYESEGEAAAEEAIARTALDAATGEIIAIGLARDDDQLATVLHRPKDGSEADLLREFFALVQEWTAAEQVQDAAGLPVWSSPPWFVAHNAAFDLGFIWRRCVVLGLRPPFALPGPNARAGKDYGCTMQAWAGYRDRISLQALCRALALPDPKAKGGGAMAWRWWEAGEYLRLTHYCACDTESVRDIWHHLAPMLRAGEVA